MVSASRSRSAGFALPWALFTLTILSLLASSGFLISWLEGRAARAFSLGTEAFYIAQGGLATALATATGSAPTLAPLAIGRGTARVSFESLIDVNPGERLFRVESEGSVSSGGGTFRRRVGRLMWVAEPPRAPAALVAWGATTGAAPTGGVSGLDAGVGCAGAPAPVSGVASLAGSFPGWPGLSVTGAPASRALPVTTSVAAEAGIRWAELLAAYGPTPDATVPPDPWPGPGVAGGWPFIRLVGGPATVGAGRSGRGTLVVDGDLTLGPGFTWSGLILVGGTATLTGAVQLRGALMAGLAGGAGPVVDLASAALDLRYDSCAVARAATRITAPAAGLPGTWYEVW